MTVEQLQQATEISEQIKNLKETKEKLQGALSIHKSFKTTTNAEIEMLTAQNSRNKVSLPIENVVEFIESQILDISDRIDRLAKKFRKL